MRILLAVFLNLFLSFSCISQVTKAPAYPLITHDPYFSIWSTSDTLTEATTSHWTGTDHALSGFVKVDGKTYRFLGKDRLTYKSLLPCGDEADANFKYVESKPGEDWIAAGFEDSSWKQGQAPFGNNLDASKTLWKTKDIWARRNFDFNEAKNQGFALRIQHDDNTEVWINGEQVYFKKGRTNRYIYVPLKRSLIQNLKSTGNVIAIHVENARGASYLDAGISKGPLSIENPPLTAQQISLNISATQSTYNFLCGKVDLKVTFTSPLLANDLDLVSRPISYISYNVKSNDGMQHDVDLFFGASSNISVNMPSQEVKAEKSISGSLNYTKVGSIEQPVLKKRGDDLRIDWGYLYVAVPERFGAKQSIYPTSSINPFNIVSTKDSISGRQLTLGTIIPIGKVGSSDKSFYTLLGYDDAYPIEYFGKNLRPWWNKKGINEFTSLLNKSSDEYESILRRCTDFDSKLFKEAVSAGGEKYAELCVIAYRQSMAAHKLVESPQKEILFLSKENASNGSINTVDITYPSAPMFLYYNPTLLRGMLNGIFYYTESGKWKKPFPAHDLGTYPLANGQTYKEDMPVEESGNMLILTAAIAKAEGDADYAKLHWQSLTTWAEYLKKEGFDPTNQLSTDDFSGHLARNSNLSIKAILGLRSYAMLAEMIGEKAVAVSYKNISTEMALKWEKMADAGNHYALTFDNKNTWSQKYNLVWDKLLGFNIFPQRIVEKEIPYYLLQQNKYGLPLDSRKTYTKSDWILWTATMATDRNDFESLVSPVHKFLTETSGRVPLSDWHETTTGKNVAFKARSVVGGYYIKMLEKKFLNQ